MLALPIRALIATWAIAVCVSPAVAQDPPTLETAVFFSVKPDRVAEFRAIQAQATERAKERGVRSRGVWRNMNNGNEYVVLVPRESYAAMTPTGSPDVEGARIRARMRQTYDSRDVLVRQRLPELGSPGATVSHMVVTRRVTVKPGMAGRYVELSKVRSDALKELGVTGFGTSRVRLGGSVNSFMSYQAIESLADLDGHGPLAKWREAAGDEVVDQWIEDIVSILDTGIERDVYVREDNLSYYPEQ